MPLPAHIRMILEQRLARQNARGRNPRPDVIHLYGTIGGDAWANLDGDFWMETYSTPVESIDVDKSIKARIHALQCGIKSIPELKELLPPRPPDASDCKACGGSGRRLIGTEVSLLCFDCVGLGWLGAW